jgi:hypothetical protein
MNKENHSNKQSNGEPSADLMDHIALGAKVFTEKASDIFSTFLDKLRETAETAYEKGTELYENVSLSAQQYLDRFRDRSEMAKLEKVRDEVATQLGYMCFMEYSGRYRFRVEFMKSDEFKKLMAQMRELDRQIIRIGEKFESET